MDQHRAMPWANGRGTSHEIARGGDDPWSWRVAIAPVVEEGPFSSLPGVDRWLVVLDDARLLLDVDGKERVARRGEVVAFAGESSVGARLPDGPTRDCGLMVRRGTATGGMQVVDGRGSVSGSVFIAVGGAVVRVDGRHVQLECGDALMGDQPTVVEVVTGRVAVAVIGA